MKSKPVGNCDASPVSEPPSPNGLYAFLSAIVIGPLKVGVIEAMLWINRPLSATLLVEVLEGLEVDGPLYPGRILYHLRGLEKYEVIEIVKRRKVRGSFEYLYFFRRLAVTEAKTYPPSGGINVAWTRTDQN